MNDHLSTQTKADILVVDDKPENLHLLNHMLSSRYKVRLVLGGREAIGAVRSMLPDLILLDIMMPEMSGFEVARRLKADPDARDIPIIFISALDDMTSKLDAFGAGGVDYVTKPFQESEVLARVHTHLALRNLQRDLQQVNNLLAQQIDELQARNQELDAFAHSVAHDLKNPLTGIYLSSSMLLDYCANMPEALDLLRQNMKILEAMNHTIESLMLLSGLRKKDIRFEIVNMGSVVEEALAGMFYLIEDTHAEIMQPTTWPEVVGYAPWVVEVWANYLSNAIKYGGRPDHGVPPHLELGFDLPANDNAHPNQARFWVRDNGPGLILKQQSQIFKPFEGLSTLHVKGHGLGLSIVERIVDKLGGQVGVESAPGEGSTFYFTLPLSGER